MLRIRQYYQLTKPGIVRGNAIPLIAGALLASHASGFNSSVFLGVVVGSSLVIASGCVFNNYFDRSIDAHMQRTKARALVQGTIVTSAAVIYGFILGMAGFSILWLFTNPLTTLIGCLGFIWYVFVYGYAKRRTPFSTLIGTVCGALPPVAGYTAIRGQIDSAAVILFLLLVTWQMPHFFAIAIRRQSEYAAAGIPLLPITRGIAVTKRHIIGWITGFTAVTPLLTLLGYTGLTYLIVSFGVSLYWLTTAMRTWRKPDDIAWATKLFVISLFVLLAQSLLIAIGSWLP